MNWDHTETIALSKPTCVVCQGSGIRLSRNTDASVCGCVLRAVFRACHSRYLYCRVQERYMSKVSLVHREGRDRRRSYERPFEDYLADFYLVSRRALNDVEFAIFDLHYLQGADWRECCAKLKIDRGTFFHQIYWIQQKLGRVYRELKPYALFPLDEYFAGRIVGAPRRQPANVVILPVEVVDEPWLDEQFEGSPEKAARKRMPLRPPVRQAA